MNRRELLRGAGAASVSLCPTLYPGLQAAGGIVEASAGDKSSRQGILINQLGYRPAGTKQATVRLPQNGAAEFVVRTTANSSIVYRGKIGSPTTDPASGDRAGIADLSALKTHGTYRIESGDLVGDLFPIGEDVYAAALKLTMRSFYGQRCGCSVDLGGGYKHPFCHGAGAFHVSSGKSGPLPNHGGWHDAGDYGRYVVNSGITTGTLLWAWELFPQPLQKLSLGIPESGGKTPDFLAEVRWNLEWMLALQDTDGGVWHKQTSEHFCAFIMPQDDTLTSYVIGTGAEPFKSTGATADLAAVMAIAARCYGSFDADFAKRCLAAARAAWSWSISHPHVTFDNPPGVATGGYGDGNLGDEIMWASAELWRTTGEAQYEKAFLAGLSSAGKPLAIGAPGWGDVRSMACWTYLLAGRPGSAETKARIREATLAAAAALVDRSRQSGYENTLALSDYVWGSNGVAGNQSLLLLIADHLHPDSTARQTALNNLHYLLGRNCFGVSWVTQLGLRPFEHPHHRPSAADGIAAPWPGLLSGGPNAHGGDQVADQLPRQPPMRMWVDDQRAYSMNEIAINWNAPLVFLLASANS
jgi:endoglucanase